MSAKTFETLLYSVEEKIATVTLNRPERMNAYTVEMMEDLIAAFDAADADDEVRAIIVTGAGRAFCAGMDLQAPSSAERPEAVTDAAAGKVPRDTAGRLTLRIFDCLKPVIAAVNGAAVGVGVTMQLPMDIRIASTDARFGFVFARRGLTVEGNATWFLPRIVGPSTALEWCFSGRVFAAQEALERGLVRSLHAPEELLPAARAIAREIADNSAPVSVALMRQMIWRMLGERHPMQGHIYESRSLFARFNQQDRNEGIGSFLEKRPASFPNTVSEDLPNIWRGWEAPGYEPEP